MALKYLTHINLNKNELQNEVIQVLPSDPQNLSTATSSSAGDSGLIWFNSSDGFLKYFNGTQTIPIGRMNFETSTANIKMNGTVSVGSLNTVARADHIHPSDTSRVPTSRTVNGHALSSDVTITRSDVGLFYGTCDTDANTQIKTIVASGFTNENYVTGTRLIIRFTYGNSYTSNPISFLLAGKQKEVQLNANQSFRETISTNQLVEFFYTGTYWSLVGYPDKNTTYTTGTIEEINAGTVSNVRIWAPDVLHNYIASVAGASADAMRFKGTLGTGGDVTSLPTTNVNIGDTYRVIEAGTYASQVCEVGDLVIATSTTPTWTVAQTNIDGAITNMSTATGISITGSGNSRTIGLASDVITATHKGDVGDRTPSWGDTFKVLASTVDTYGRTIGLTEHTVKIPSSNATTAVGGLMSSDDKRVVNLTKNNGMFWQNEDSYTISLTNSYIGWDAAILKEDAIGKANGIAPLNASTKIDAQYLPVATTATAGAMSAYDKRLMEDLEVFYYNFLMEEFTNPLLTPAQNTGICTWSIDMKSASLTMVEVKETSTGAKVITDVVYNTTNDTVQIKIVSSSQIPAGTYTAVVCTFANGA